MLVSLCLNWSGVGIHVVGVKQNKDRPQILDFDLDPSQLSWSSPSFSLSALGKNFSSLPLGGRLEELRLFSFVHLLEVEMFLPSRMQ